MRKTGQIFQKSRIAWQLPIAIVMVAGGFGIKNSGLLSPGSLSMQHKNGQPIQGYVSHADFQNDCLHCHAPVHCLTDDRCQECHMEIARQRAEGVGLHSLVPGTEKCQTCHTEHQGHEASITDLALQNINHELMTGFSLDLHGKDYDDTELDCESCHSQNRFVAATLDCITCHVNADHEGMAEHIEEFGTGCTDCHDGKDRMTDFDHSPYYLLDGAHQDVECGECHLNKQYLETPNQCIDCHPEPELHAGIFGQDCNRCHTATAWAPAQLLKHTFLIDHDPGPEDIETCETCHAGSYTQYPCYNCHLADEMELAHVDEEVANLEDCLSCHPTGRGVVEGPEGTSGIFEIIAEFSP